GRTIGKRLTGIRVISADGRRLRPSQIVARNMMKEAEFLAPAQVFLMGGESGLMLVLTFLWVCGVAGFFLRNKRRQRLGDVIAGTLVVEQPRAV
ncbi:RDD family protein, partial [Streptomyces sp. P17]|uniref:RDD family protein n=1 Tax=Streptomyces sp. P17 TaxID=3074716 RepID=UPI0028F419AE